MSLTNNSVAQSGQKSNGFPKNNRLHRKSNDRNGKNHIYPREVYKKQPLSEQLGEAARKMQAWEAGVGCGKTSQFAYGAQGAHRVPDGTPAGRPPRRVPAALPPERVPPGCVYAPCFRLNGFALYAQTSFSPGSRSSFPVSSSPDAFRILEETNLFLCLTRLRFRCMMHKN